MPEASLAPPPAPLFYTLPMFKAAGLPGKTRAYELAKTGQLRLVKDAAGRVGITAEEAHRYFSTVQDLADCKRDLRKATAAHVVNAAAARRAGQ